MADARKLRRGTYVTGDGLLIEFVTDRLGIPTYLCGSEVVDDETSTVR
jgi:hypothetical protein